RTALALTAGQENDETGCDGHSRSRRCGVYGRATKKVGEPGREGNRLAGAGDAERLLGTFSL
ncbi:MAG: hypothetical protein ACR2J8_06250, partial [Thermomicrobiales bacterium]